MPLSRRDFLGNIGKAAAAKAMPSSVLGVPLQSLIEIPTQASVSLASTKDAIDSLSRGWFGYRVAFSELSEMRDHVAWNISRIGNYNHETKEYSTDIRPDLETRVKEKFDQCLPALFGAIDKLRAVRQGVLTGDPQHDDKVLGGLKAITSLQKNYYLEELDHLVALCPAEYSSLPEIENPCDYSDLENRDQWNKDHQEYWGKQEYVEWSKSFKNNLDRYKSFNLALIKSEYESFLFRSVNLGLVDASFIEMSEHRHITAFSSVKPVCEAINLPEDVALSLTESIDGVQIFEWFDEKKLFQHVVDMLGKRADKYIHGISMSGEGDPTGYIVNHFETILQERFKHYFSAALPDVLIENIPLPCIDRSLAGFVKLQQSFLNQGQTAIEDTESTASKDMPIGSTAGEASAEAETGFARIPSSLRLLATNAVRDNGDERPAANGTTLDTPASAIHPSPTTLMENAGITLPRPGKIAPVMAQTPAP